MNLTEIVKQLDASWATAPIYRKGVTLPNGQKACGKSPLARAAHEDLAPAVAAWYIDENPELFGACGVYTGARSKGLVILDVDRNLTALTQKWGADLNAAPCIKSAKKNAAKFLFYVPEVLWPDVAGLSHAATQGEGFEVLWGPQGVIAGEYAGGGSYELTGDLKAIPEAPVWLLERMKAEKTTRNQPERSVVDSRYARRTKEEKILIARQCLSVIAPRGAGSERFWWEIGAMIATELPGDEGLELWREWSKTDPDYAFCWEGGDPCAARWASGFHGGGLNMGSLIHLANQADPHQERFRENGLLALVQDCEAQTIRFKNEVIPFAELMSRAKECMEIDNPAEMTHALHTLATAANYRDTAPLEKMLLDDQMHQMQQGSQSLVDLMATDYQTDYLIPDVLPTPSTLLLHGAGGTGKSMVAWVLAKHVAEGKPFMVRGKLMDVKQGPVIIFNGDQPESSLQNQLIDADLDPNAPIHIFNGWQICRQLAFIKAVKKIKPALIIFDSLIGCSGGKAFDENKSDFASPLYWLTNQNGRMFDPCSIVFIHHANKTGGFRGTSAIRDAVSEEWNITKPDGKNADKDARIITVHKSRSGRTDCNLLLKQERDLSFSLSDWQKPEEMGSTVSDRILQRLRVVHPAARTRAELQMDPLVNTDGSVEAVKKSLQRLAKRKLVEVSEERATTKGGRATKYYKAVVAEERVTRGASKLSPSPLASPGTKEEKQWDTPPKSDKVSHCESEPVTQKPAKKTDFRTHTGDSPKPLPESPRQAAMARDVLDALNEWS